MVDLNLVVKNIKQICRICLEESTTMSNIYENVSGYELSVEEMLTNCMSLKFENNEMLPELICYRCKAETIRIWEFKAKYNKSNTFLQNYVSNLQNVESDQLLFVNAIKVEEDSVPVDSIVVEVVDNENETQIIKNEQERDKTSDDEGYKHIEKVNRFVCKKCKEPFNTKMELVNHQRKLMHYIRKTMICSKCNREISVQNYKTHFLTHFSNFKCKICDKIFSNNYNLKRHHHIHTKLTPYACDVCDAKFARQDKLKQHVMMHEFEKPFLCKCREQFQKFEELRLHQECSDCKECDSKYKRILSCDICSKTFTLPSSLEIHKLLHTDAKVICSLCGHAYANEKILQAHVLRVHKAKRSDTRKKDFLCNICGKQFSNKIILERHILSHKGLAKTHTCRICSKGFTQSGSLMMHMKIHTGEKPYVCRICSRAFNKVCNLQRHTRSHYNIRPYICTICEQSFTSKQSLEVHVRIHTGEKPYSCSICDKRFNDRGGMTRHFKRHYRQDQQ